MSILKTKNMVLKKLSRCIRTPRFRSILTNFTGSEQLPVRIIRPTSVCFFCPINFFFRFPQGAEVRMNFSMQHFADRRHRVLSSVLTNWAMVAYRAHQFFIKTNFFLSHKNPSRFFLYNTLYDMNIAPFVRIRYVLFRCSILDTGCLNQTPIFIQHPASNIQYHSDSHGQAYDHRIVRQNRKFLQWKRFIFGP